MVPGKSEAAGVGTLLVAGVEYSPSVDTSNGVWTDETDSLPMSFFTAPPTLLTFESTEVAP